IVAREIVSRRSRRSERRARVHRALSSMEGARSRITRIFPLLHDRARRHRPCKARGSAMSSSTRTDRDCAFDLYRASLHGGRTLAPEEERALAVRWRNGDSTAGDRLIRASLPFVISVALEYRRWGVPIDDLVQQGNLGLLKAAKKFDPTRECRLITYAVYWIRAEI